MPLILLILLFVSAGEGLAQDASSAGKMFFSSGEACVAAPEGAFSIYQPKYQDKLGWWKEMISLGKAEHVLDSKARCAEEFTVVGWRIVRWPAGIGYFKAGDRMADPRCGNAVRNLWEIPETPPPPPPPPASTTGFVSVTKLAFDPDGRSMPVPTGVFEIRVGDYLVPLDANGQGTIEVPAGTYEVLEKFDEKVWEWIYVSSRTFTLRAGETVNIELKNQQRRPKAVSNPESSHVCADCLGFESVDAEGFGVELDSVSETTPRFFITGRFKGGPVTDHKWSINGETEIVGEKLEVDPSNLQPGYYKLRLTARDQDGHEVSCETSMAVLLPPPPPPITKRHRRLIPCWNWPFGRASLPICAAGVVGGYAIAGGFAAGAVGTKVPTAVAVGLVH